MSNDYNIGFRQSVSDTFLITYPISSSLMAMPILVSLVMKISLVLLRIFFHCFWQISRHFSIPFAYVQYNKWKPIMTILKILFKLMQYNVTDFCFHQQDIKLLFGSKHFVFCRLFSGWWWWCQACNWSKWSGLWPFFVKDISIYQTALVINLCLKHFFHKSTIS